MLDETTQTEETRTQQQLLVWPTPSRLALVLWRNKGYAAAGMLAVMTISSITFRMREKNYRSVAVVSSTSIEPTNPLKEIGGEAQGTLAVTGFFLDRMRTSMFSYDLIAEAARSAGILGSEKNRFSLREGLSRVLWSLAGGSIRSEESVVERSIIDKIRFERMTFERMDRPATDPSQGGIFRVTASFQDPSMAQTFLRQVLDLHLESLKKEEEESNARLAKFYDDQIAFLATQATGSDSKVDFAGNRTRLQRVSRLRAELDAKLQQESALRSTLEGKVAQVREQLSNAEGKYSATHPEVVALRQTLRDANQGMRAPVDRVSSEILSLKKKIDSEFSRLVDDSSATAEGSGTMGEGHTQYFTKEQTERRSISRLYERMQERYFQAVVQAKLSNVMNPDRFRILENPSLPLRPDTPRLIPWLVASIALAGIFGFLCAILREITRKRANDSWLIASHSRCPIWGEQRANAYHVLEPEDVESHATQETGPKIGRKMPAIKRELKGKGGRKAEAAESLASLFAHLAVHGENRRFSCGFTSLTGRTPSSLIAFNMATLVAQRTGLKTLLVTLGHPESLSKLLDLPERKPDEVVVPVPHYGFSLMEVAVSDDIGRVNALAEAGGFEAVIWDLPPSDQLTWSALRLPRMPLVGVAESGHDTYAGIAKGSRWIRLMEISQGFPSGIYLTRSTTPRWMQNSECTVSKRAA